jgi:hypothetical protein
MSLSILLMVVPALVNGVHGVSRYCVAELSVGTNEMVCKATAKYAVEHAPKLIMRQTLKRNEIGARRGGKVILSVLKLVSKDTEKQIWISSERITELTTETTLSTIGSVLKRVEKHRRNIPDVIVNSTLSVI